MSFFDVIASADRAAQDLLGGVPVIYRPNGGDPVVPNPIGIFDAQYVLVQGGDAHAGVESVSPAVFLRREDLPGDPDDDDPDTTTVTIGGIDYRVAGVKPDGIGGIVLVLRKAG
jgi:hypothetical protein